MGEVSKSSTAIMQWKQQSPQNVDRHGREPNTRCHTNLSKYPITSHRNCNLTKVIKHLLQERLDQGPLRDIRQLEEKLTVIEKINSNLKGRGAILQKRLDKLEFTQRPFADRCQPSSNKVKYAQREPHQIKQAPHSSSELSSVNQAVEYSYVGLSQQELSTQVVTPVQNLTETTTLEIIPNGNAPTNYNSGVKKQCFPDVTFKERQNIVQISAFQRRKQCPIIKSTRNQASHTDLELCQCNLTKQDVMLDDYQLRCCSLKCSQYRQVLQKSLENARYIPIQLRPSSPIEFSTDKKHLPEITAQILRNLNNVILTLDCCDESKQFQHNVIVYFLYSSPSKNVTKWQRIGAIEPLTLPFACTLLRYFGTHNYSFAVLAVGNDGKVGNLSNSCSLKEDFQHS